MELLPVAGCSTRGPLQVLLLRLVDDLHSRGQNRHLVGDPFMAQRQTLVQSVHQKLFQSSTLCAQTSKLLFTVMGRLLFRRVSKQKVLRVDQQEARLGETLLLKEPLECGAG